MIRTILRCGIAALTALLIPIAACRQGAKLKPAGTVVASVNGDHLTKDELAGMVPEGYTVDATNLPTILDKWTSATLMYQEAIKRGIRREPEVQARLKRLERDYLVNEFIDRLTTSVKVPEADLLSYFNAHRDQFTYEVKIARIVLPDSAQAALTLTELRSGADFKKLAKERSQDVLLEAGQESRYFARGIGDPRMGGDPTMEEAIFSLAPGEISNVIHGQEGYQIVKLVDKKKVKSDVGFAETREYIEAILSYRASQALVDSVLSSLRQNAKIELKPDAYFK